MAPPGSAVQEDTSTGFSLCYVVTSKGKLPMAAQSVRQLPSMPLTPLSGSWRCAELQAGHFFTAKWAGDNFSREDSWTVSSDGAQSAYIFTFSQSRCSSTRQLHSHNVGGSTTAQPYNSPYSPQLPRLAQLLPHRLQADVLVRWLIALQFVRKPV